MLKEYAQFNKKPAQKSKKVLLLQMDIKKMSKREMGALLMELLEK